MNFDVNVTLNGKNIKGVKGETILSLAKRNGIEIPTLCNDDRLEPYSSCFVCVVEIKGMKGHQPSCSTKITEGMVITTDSEEIIKSRKTALELILSNHYADCSAPCKQTCPAGVDVQGYISLIDKGLYSEAVKVIKETNPLPAICGRVCVRPCEVACRRNLLDEGNAVGIDYMKRFAADYDLNSSSKYKPEIKSETGKKIAVIGAGPGGLSSAFFLRKQGHSVDIYEAAPNAGGWLRYGIPEYRLPNDLLQKEVDNISEMGVNIYYNKKLGENISYNEIKSNYDATVLAIGCQKGTLVGCEGDDAKNVYSGIDFLKEMELTGEKKNFKGKTVIVVGGGNTAMDCCRTSIRCGAEKVYVVYRRTEKEMPANPIEIHESKLEGVEYLFLNNPTKIIKDSEGKVIAVRLIKMGLGEPDSSGRRRPVPVDGSEYEINTDYVLAAIGQKTVINFIEDINNSSEEGKLEANKWGDIDANSKTLQTGIPSVFAAGDGVTGAATLIEAIAQAKVASLSAHQFVMGLPIKPIKKEFLSKKDNFKKQVNADYLGKYKKQIREEMPTLEPDNRSNFNEVELGYISEKVAKNEAQRCLECGCTEYFTCDLKKYATEYDVQQNIYKGEFKEYNVDFRHQYIEIDNNKCVLCSRCVRVCKEVVGANALGLVNRGFNTYIAPTMGNSLSESSCESCGLCISACPTGAITENVTFKPGPVKLDKVDTIDFLTSEGSEISLFHKGGYFIKAQGRKGEININSNISRQAKFGYRLLNDNNRITTPLIKRNNKFEPISFDEAYKIISDKIKSVNANENMFFAGARLTNEELYLIQKLARLAVKTNNVSSFHYLNRGKGYKRNSEKNVSFNEINGASKIYIVGTEIQKDNSFISYIVNNTRFKKKISVELITNNNDSKLFNKVDNSKIIKSYYYFIKAVNYFLIAENEQNMMYINDNCEGFDEYKNNILSENYNDLISKSGASKEYIEEWAKNYNNEINAILIYSEKELSSSTCFEIRNLAKITGKLGKISNGLISIKENNNSQGLIDMGINPSSLVGDKCNANTEAVEAISKVWNSKIPSAVDKNTLNSLTEGKYKNVIIFDEDPIGCALDKNKIKTIIKKADFIVVQDYYITETAELADLILPSSLGIETGGSYTNTQKYIQKFDKVVDSKVEHTNINQIVNIYKNLGITQSSDINDVLNEIISILPKSSSKLKFDITSNDDESRMFNYGCNTMLKQFEENFKW